MKPLFLCLPAICTMFFSVPSQAASKQLSKPVLIKMMQEGGFVIYIRHASTEKDYADQVKADVNDGSTQRVLSE